MKKNIAPPFWEPAYQKIREAFDIEYAHKFASSLSEQKTNPVLGYRTAGSEASRLTGERIAEEMEGLGLTVEKDSFTLDGWDFHHARLSFPLPPDDPSGEQGVYLAELGGYQTQFDTNGPQTYSIINAGRGTAKELDSLDLNGKLVLITINQRDDWWINYPAYQAHLRGALAVLAVQSRGYGEVNARALNAQDICGPADAPAFSISKKDAKRLIRSLSLPFGSEALVTFDARSTVMKDTKDFNVVGRMEGEEDGFILLSAHYDSYFDGFQDDNAAVALLLSIGKALKESGYRPRKTLLFCALAAEEWGTINTRYDWSTGAYNQVFRLHPEWAGQVLADLNFELPARAHGAKHFIRCVYEYQSFLKEQVKRLPKQDAGPYSKGIGVVSPVQTWSDDFSMAIGGIPSIVNEFSSGSFMETHYHSQYDNEELCDREAYAFHHRLYTRLLLAFDHLVLPPLHFGPRLEALGESLTEQGLDPFVEGAFRTAATQTVQAARRLYKETSKQNAKYLMLLGETPELACSYAQKRGEKRRKLLKTFRFCEDQFVVLNWNEQTLFPHETYGEHLRCLRRAVWQLAVSDAAGAIKSLTAIDDNLYASSFDKEVTDFFADAALSQPPERLMWGKGRLQGRLSLRELIMTLEEGALSGRQDFTEEIFTLQKQIEAERLSLEQAVQKETEALERLLKRMQKLLPKKEKKDGPPSSP